MADSNLISDIQTSFEGGVNAGVSPQRVGTNQCFEAVNTQFRSGQPHSRPAWPIVPLTFLNDPNGTSQAYYTNNFFQGGAGYHTPTADYMVHVVGGHVFILEPFPNRIEVTDVTPADGGNNPYKPVCWCCQADKYFIIQDGEHTPIVLYGLTSKRADGVNPIPVATVMAYGQNRLWVAIKDQVLAGDLVGSEQDAVLKFSEAIYLNEGGSFSPVVPIGNVRSMAFIAVQDTSTGQGGLLIGYDNGFLSINGLVPRDQWKNTQIQQVTLVGVGATGARSGCNVNGDYFFESHDGWRAYRQARAQQGGWSQLPLSSAVRQYVDNEWATYREFVSAVYFDNRLMVTVGPTATNGRAYHQGLLSLDFDVVNAGLAQATQPAWDGLWTLVGNPVQLFAGVFRRDKRCFCVCLQNGANVLCEYTDDYSDGGTPIAWSLTTKRFLFAQKNAPHVKCRLVDGGDVRISEAVGNSTLTVNYRQDDASNWKKWANFTIAGQGNVCATSTDGTCSITLPPESYVPRLILPNLPNSTDGVTNRVDDLFYDAQFQLVGTGYFQLEWFRPQATYFSDKKERAV